MNKLFAIEIRTTLTRVIELQSRDAASAMGYIQEVLDLRPKSSTDPMIGQVKSCESKIVQVKRS